MPRTVEAWVDPAGPGAAFVELVELGWAEEPVSGWRFQIPAPGRNCVSWLKGASKTEALVEIGEPGRLRVLPWHPHGEAVVQRRRQLSEDQDEDTRTELLFLTERFRRVHIEKSGRFPVHERERAHLGLGPKSLQTALLICLRTHVELWSEEFRQRWRDEHVYELPWEKAP